MTYTVHAKRGAALMLLLGLLVAFFAPYAYLYAQENPPTPPQTEPAPTAPPADTPTEPATPTTPTTPSTPANTTVSPNTGGQGGFVPLTSIPGVSEVTGADGIASFLNQLYRIAIGAAAVLAILQITRAGLMYMTEESISERKEARHIIMMAILGLVLVLSPAIVFGIIDPRILNLSVDLSGIQPTNPRTQGPADVTGYTPNVFGNQTNGNVGTSVTGTTTPNTNTGSNQGGGDQQGDAGTDAGTDGGGTTVTEGEEVEVTAPQLGEQVPTTGNFSRYSGPYTMRVEAHFTSLGYLGNNTAGDCLIMKKAVYANENKGVARQQCLAAANSYAIAACVDSVSGATKQVNVQGVCAYNGQVMDPM